MGSATRSALTTARATLESAKGADLTTGEHLLAAARIIGSSSQLLSALTGHSSSDAQRAALLDRLFGDLSTTARTLLDGIVSDRWSSGHDLLAGIEEIGIRCIAAAAGRDAALEKELFAFGRAVASHADLELAISSKRGSDEGKLSLVTNLVGSSASPHAVAVIGHLVQQPRGRRVGALVRAGAEIVADAHGRGVATVTVASPLTNAQSSAVQATITARYGREHTLDEVIEPSVVGGVRVQVGDEVIDGSVSARLTELKLRLAG